MSIHRPDLPNAPYRIRRSDFGTAWVWYHFCDGTHPKLPLAYGATHGRAPTREQAAALAAIHATTAHGASLDHFRTLLPVLREMGVLDTDGTPRTPVGSRVVLHATSDVLGPADGHIARTIRNMFIAPPYEMDNEYRRRVERESQRVTFQEVIRDRQD